MRDRTVRPRWLYFKGSLSLFLRIMYFVLCFNFSFRVLDSYNLETLLLSERSFIDEEVSQDS